MLNRMSILHALTLLLAIVALQIAYSIPPYVLRDAEPLYKGFLDPEFPFIEATVDLRGAAPEKNEDNLIPRAIVLPLDGEVYVCFDTELLRVAGVWKGGFLSPQGLAMLSYDVPLRKMGSGQKRLPQPMGDMLMANGLYPGWLDPDTKSFDDPRSRWIDENELGRGPIGQDTGEWLGMEDAGSEAILHYRLKDGRVRERFQTLEIDGRAILRRLIEVTGVSSSATLVALDRGPRARGRSFSGSGLTLVDGRYATREIALNDSRRVFALDFDIESGSITYREAGVDSFNVEKTQARWRETVTSSIQMGASQGAYAVDELTIPYPNPWMRRIRPIAIDFFPDGDAVIVTFDGDVYRVSGLGKSDNEIAWRRIAAGFNEPQSIRIRGEEIFVFSRLGITRLVDRDGDGETDVYEMFCNRFTQSADTRDYPLSLALRPDGSFIISKGGQQASHRSPHSGRVMSISADGKDVGYFAFGLRNGYVSAHPRKDLLTASDQQGNWVPSTPFHIVRDGSYLGYDPGSPFSETPIQPPALWMPHRVVQSGIEHIWMGGDQAGSDRESILYIEYKKPSIFQIFVPESGPFSQTAGAPLPVEFQTPILKGAVNPIDGIPYFVGFQIWDSVASRIEGICRLRRLNDSDGIPESGEAGREGVRLTFDRPLNFENSRDPARFQVSSWEYKRTADYGSPQFKADGAPGVDNWFVHSVHLSEDRRSVFLAIDGLRTTMQLEVQYNLFGEWNPVYFTINELNPIDLQRHGFDALDFNAVFSEEPVERESAVDVAIASVARGQDLYERMGCIGCHSIDGSTEGRSGPTWLGAFKSRRRLADGSSVRVDEDYLRTSILDPAAVITQGYDGQEAGMPSYRGILGEADIESLVMFIRSLR